MLADELGRRARHPEPRLQRPDPGPRLEEVRHGLGRPLDTPTSGGRRSTSAASTSPTPRSSGRRRATRPRRRSRPGTPPDKTITSLQGSTAEKLVAEHLPERQVEAPSPTRTPRSSRSPRAARTGSWSRTTCSRSSTSRTTTRSQRSRSPEPLPVAYGSYAVQKGNDALADRLSEFICEQQDERRARLDLRGDDRRSRCRRCRTAAQPAAGTCRPRRLASARR